MKELLFFILGLAVSSLFACKTKVIVDKEVKEYPLIFPDYIGVTIPPNIAPLNFRVEGDSISLVDVSIEDLEETKFHIQSNEVIEIPQSRWKKLVKGAVGDSLRFSVRVRKNDEWFQYAAFPVYVSNDSVDYGLTYRLIAPGYEVYSKMGIYQRSLSDFSQTPIVENTLFQGSCMNCHSFRQTNGNEMSLHIRGPQGGTVLMKNESLQMLDTKTKETLSNCVYPYWHPSGKYIAYSVNKTQQAFHAADNKRIEVFDHASDVVVYNIETNNLFSCDLLKSEDNFETFPAFSPDGRSLYFCSSRSKFLPDEFKDIKYDLLKISFDPESGEFGNKVDTLVYASKMGKSISFPRPSYDGKYLMYTLFNYGNFSIWHPEADLWMYNLQTGKTKPMNALNSGNTESYHSWSSNSKWVVFSSRRVNGLYTTPYLAHIDDSGDGSKPFLLSQKNPNFYDATFYSFNVPEFINKPVALKVNKLETIFKARHKQVNYLSEEK
jgi:hypothetical protein